LRASPSAAGRGRCRVGSGYRHCMHRVRGREVTGPRAHIPPAWGPVPSVPTAMRGSTDGQLGNGAASAMSSGPLLRTLFTRSDTG